MTPVRLEPAALRSRVKHSTTEPLLSRIARVSELNSCTVSHIPFFQEVLNGCVHLMIL